MKRCPIVYSARYYSSPQQPNKPSYWHLYGIHSDGTGRAQLTHAYADDQSPQWSPKGSYISLLRRRRAYRNTAGPTMLCVWDSDGDVRTVYSATDDFEHHWLDENTLLVRENQRCFKINIRTGRRLLITAPLRWHTEQVSPDGKMAFLDDPPRLVHLTTNKIVPFPATVWDALWLTDTRLLCLMAKRDADGMVNDYSFAELGLDGKLLRTWKMELSAAAKAMCENSIIPFCCLAQVPNKKDSFLLGSRFGGTSTGPWYRFLRVDLATHRAEPWGTALDLSFSPDATQFVTTYCRKLVPYGKTGKNLYVQSLSVASTKQPDKQTEIVKGLVLVDSAQWRPV